MNAKRIAAFAVALTMMASVLAFTPAGLRLRRYNRAASGSTPRCRRSATSG